MKGNESLRKEFIYSMLGYKKFLYIHFNVNRINNEQVKNRKWCQVEHE